jgi:hypothetical protein
MCATDGYKETIKNCSMRKLNMRKLVVSAWVTLDGVFDAGTMNQWFIPFDSLGR